MNVASAAAMVLVAIALVVVARPTKVFAAVILLSIFVSTINYLLYTPPVQLFFFASILFAAVFISTAIIIGERGITPENDALCSSISRLIKMLTPEINTDKLMRGIVIALASTVIGSTLYYAVLQWLRAPIIAAFLTTLILAASEWLTVRMLRKRGLDVAVLTLIALAIAAIPQVQPYISEAFSGIDESMRYVEVILSALG